MVFVIQLIDAGFGGANIPDEGYPCSWHKGKGAKVLCSIRFLGCYNIDFIYLFIYELYGNLNLVL